MRTKQPTRYPALSLGPSPNVIRQLVLSKVLPVITYGWPLWSPPTDRHWAKLECALCLPLRRCLSLPPNVHRLAVLVEFGLPNLRLKHEELAISYAHRLSNQPSAHLASQLLVDQYRRPLQTSLNSLTPLGSYLKQVEARWNWDHTLNVPAFKRSLRSRALSMQIDQLRKGVFSRLLRSLSLKPAPCSYIKLEQRPLAILRARLRLNRTHLNYSKFRRNLAESPHCPSCPGTDESAHHALFVCPTFAAARHDCLSMLDAFDCPITFEVLTGDVSSIPPRYRDLALDASAKLLLTINVHRPI